MLVNENISDYNLVLCFPGFSSGASSLAEALAIAMESVERALQGSRPWALWEGATAVLFALSVCQGGFRMGAEVSISGMNAGLSTPAAVIRVIMMLKWDTMETTL